jgi:hypothetical protein
MLLQNIGVRSIVYGGSELGLYSVQIRPGQSSLIIKHPFRNRPNARLVCNIVVGSPVNFEVIAMTQPLKI